MRQHAFSTAWIMKPHQLCQDHAHLPDWDKQLAAPGGDLSVTAPIGQPMPIHRLFNTIGSNCQIFDNTDMSVSTRNHDEN